jgi:hypothetical protein
VWVLVLVLLVLLLLLLLLLPRRRLLRLLRLLLLLLLLLVLAVCWRGVGGVVACAVALVTGESKWSDARRHLHRAGATDGPVGARDRGLTLASGVR